MDKTLFVINSQSVKSGDRLFISYHLNKLSGVLINFIYKRI